MSSTEPQQQIAPKGLYAVGSAGLTIEAIVVLLAVPAVISAQRGHVSVPGVSFIGAVVVLLIASVVVLRRSFGKGFASVVQVLVIGAGVVTWPMYVVGVIFAGIWIYWLRQWGYAEKVRLESQDQSQNPQ